MIKIEKNTWKKPTEIRENVVQDICDAFLNHCAWSTFHPYSEGCYRRATLCVVRHKGYTKAYGFHDEPFRSDEGIRVRGCEMETAFAELRKAGYHIFRVYEYGSWMGYVVSHKDYKEGGTEVFEFTDEID